MFSSETSRKLHDENLAEWQRRRGDRRPALSGLRAAILAGLVVAATGGVAAADVFVEDPVRAIADAHTTCCAGDPTQPK